MQKRWIFLILLVVILAIMALTATLSQREIMLRLIASLQNMSSCGSCLSFLVPLQMLARIGDDAFVEGLVDLCVGLNIQEEDVCQGALQSQGPIIAHALRSISLSKRTGTLFCSEILGLCPYPAVPHYSFPLSKPTVNATVPLSGQKPTIKFVHVSDVHIDREYQTGSEARCDKPICCRGPIEGKVTTPAGRFGNYNCDTPTVLFDSMLDAINEYAGDAQAVLFSGDVVDHAVWLSSKEIVTESVEAMYASMLKKLKMPVYGAIGNHDVHPTNAFARGPSDESLPSDWALELHERVWAPYIGEQEAKMSSMHHSGSYSHIHPHSNLRVISFNTNYAYKANYWLYDSDEWVPDSNGLFTWLAKELQAAETNGQRVWIIGHMSAGKGDFLQDASAIYDNIIQRYRHTISAQFYGHTHRAEFEIGYSTYAQRDETTATTISYVAPALTPSSGNPVFRIYEVDPDSYQVMDFIEITASLWDSSYQHGPQWKPYYSARESYGSLLFDRPLADHEPLDGPFWHRVTEAFERDNQAFFMFMQRLYRGSRRVRCWSEQCKQNWITALRTARSEYARHVVGGHQPWKRDVLSTVEDVEDHELEEEDPHKAGCSSRAEDARSILHRLVHGTDSAKLTTFLQKKTSEKVIRPSWSSQLSRIYRRR